MQLQKSLATSGFARNDRNAASCGVGVVVVFFLLTVPPGEIDRKSVV